MKTNIKNRKKSKAKVKTADRILNGVFEHLRTFESSMVDRFEGAMSSQDNFDQELKRLIGELTAEKLNNARILETVDKIHRELATEKSSAIKMTKKSEEFGRQVNQLTAELSAERKRVSQLKQDVTVLTDLIGKAIDPADQKPRNATWHDERRQWMASYGWCKSELDRTSLENLHLRKVVETLSTNCETTWRTFSTALAELNKNKTISREADTQTRSETV